MVHTSACGLVMSTHHEVLDVSSTIHSFALILLWCKVGPVGMPLSVRRSRHVGTFPIGLRPTKPAVSKRVSYASDESVEAHTIM